MYLANKHPVVFLLVFIAHRIEPRTVPSYHSQAARAIGERIRDARHALGISMDDLSELSELSLTSIGKIERGTQSPSAETLVRIGTVLGVDPGSFLAGLTSADYGARTRGYTARDFIREQEAKRPREG